MLRSTKIITIVSIAIEGVVLLIGILQGFYLFAICLLFILVKNAIDLYEEVHKKL